VNDPTAVMGRRIAAYLIDGLIVFGIAAIAFFALGDSQVTDISADENEGIIAAFGEPNEGFNFAWDLGEATGGYIDIGDGFGDDLSFRIVSGGKFWVVNLVWLAAALGFLVFMQGATGKTPGKAAVGIQTVREDGGPPGLGKALARWLLLFVDAFFILPGLISALASKGHRRIGDMAAGTYVVRADAAGRPVTLDAPGGYAMAAPQYASSAPPPAQPAADAQWDANRNAWIRWDGQAWAQFDPATGGWRPL
jgi:uncharacterized RDD family membrane protein YckC